MMLYNTTNIISKCTTRAVIGVMHINQSLPCILAFTGTKTTQTRTTTPLLCPRDSHIKQLVQHTRQQDENGKMYRIILDYGQLLARVQYLVLQYPKLRLPHIKDTLITIICQFLLDSQLNIVIPNLYIPKLLQENNQNIMGKLHKIKESPIDPKSQSVPVIPPDHLAIQHILEARKKQPSQLLHQASFSSTSSTRSQTLSTLDLTC
jgi:hypothetical protein